MLDNQRWPSDEKVAKKATKNAASDVRTVGLYNLGNTCYINSVI